MFDVYYTLIKPGIVYSNVLTAAAGFLLGSQWHIDWRLFIATLVGTSLVIASACVFNNVLDRRLDKAMARTQKRALVSGRVSVPAALTYATVLGIVGFAVLALYVSGLVVGIGALAMIDYVIVYGWFKRHSVHGTLVGSISGAAPISAGYVAAAGRIDAAAVILFIMLACWQMPHFYAIGLYRRNDYAAAGLPILPVHQKLTVVRRQMLAYIMTFIVASILLTVWGYTGYIYAVVSVAFGLTWLYKGWGAAGRPLKAEPWGKRMFLFSLIVILELSVMVAVGGLLP